MFSIQELPFFVLFILTLLPLTVGIIILIRLIETFKSVIHKYKQKESFSLITFGEILVYLTIFMAVMNIILYLTGNQPPDFSISDYLLEDTLPNVWYVILLYGILVEFTILINRRK